MVVGPTSRSILSALVVIPSKSVEFTIHCWRLSSSGQRFGCRDRVLISLETTVWCSALHTTNNMETGLGVTELWVKPRYMRSVGCLIRIWRGFGRTALIQRWGKSLHRGAQVFERRSWIRAKYNEGWRWRGLDEREWCGQWRDNENATINEGAILERHETIRKGRSTAINEYWNTDLRLQQWVEITCCFLQNTSSSLY